MIQSTRVEYPTLGHFHTDSFECSNEATQRWFIASVRGAKCPAGEQYCDRERLNLEEKKEGKSKL